MISLCHPSPTLSCFRCCPPIRPAGYDHLDYRSEVTRHLIENTDNFQAGRLGGTIIGFSCWGLGFVDPQRRLAGCLLHPVRNREDLRIHTGYREKCARETCPQHTTFTHLEVPVRETLLGLVSGLDSFEYSSPRSNPLWNLLPWGQNVLTAVHIDLVPDSPLYRYLTSHPAPKSRAFLLSGLLPRLMSSGEYERVLAPDFGARFEKEAERICRELESACASPEDGEAYVHRLGLDQSLVEFIRFGLKRLKIKKELALEIAERVESALDRLMVDLIQG